MNTMQSALLTNTKTGGVCSAASAARPSLLMKIKEPGSAVTHFLTMLAALIASTPLMMKAAVHGSSLHCISLGIFCLSMVLLYGASTAYHTFDISDAWNRRLKKLDHSMISVLIAGTYTPVCLIVLEPSAGYPLLAAVWAIALLGIVIKLFFIYCPKWFSSVLYIALGWACIFAMPSILKSLPLGGFLWLLAGGIIYTIGGVIYALKLPVFDSLHPYFGTHEIFHLFCTGGTICHFLFMYHYVAVL